MSLTSVSLLSGKALARTDNAFASEKPMLQNHAQRLALSNLRLPKNMEMIGGLHGRKPTQADMRRFADLLEKDWNLRHHEPKSYEEHFADIKLRFETINAPTFVAYGSGGWPDAAFFPIFAARTPSNDSEILSRAFWNTDFSGGPVFLMRKSAADREYSAGLERDLMAKAVIPYTRALAGIGEISNAFFYTWHLNGTFQSAQHKEEMQMHLELGAIPARTFKDGRIEEMIYSHLLG